jgi:hypothetical protein
MPLTIGQVVASRVAAGETRAANIERALAEELAAARSQGRRAERAIERDDAPRARVEEAVAVAAERERDVAYLATELASIRPG